MVHGIPVRKTILKCDDLKEFQFVTKIGSKYEYILHGDTPIKEKCIRIFASTDKKDAGVFKLSKRTGKPEKIASSPLNCFIYNDEVNNVKIPGELDKHWYINVAYERLENFGV
jgi:DNA polymerase